MSSNNVLTLTPTEVYEFVTSALQCKQVPYIAGPPAIGKSQIVHQVAKDANALMIDLRLSQILSEDMTGIPEKNSNGKASYIPFETFPLEGDPIPEGYNGWLIFLDELSSASEEVLAASYSLILDRTVGGRKLHSKCLVVAAGNRASDSAIARELPDTLITRMLIAEMKVNHKDWCNWASGFANRNDAVVDFIRKNPKLLYSPTKAKEREENETYSQPRGWEKVFAHVNMHERLTMVTEEGVDASGIPTGQTVTNGTAISAMCFNMISAAVGVTAARAFKDEYDENIQLPFPWEIAQTPASTRIPGSSIAKARLMADLSKYFLESDTQTRDNCLIYINRISGEYSELFVNEITQKLGQAASDKKLILETSERLNIDPLLGGTSTRNRGSDIDPSNPF